MQVINVALPLIRNFFCCLWHLSDNFSVIIIHSHSSLEICELTGSLRCVVTWKQEENLYASTPRCNFNWSIKKKQSESCHRKPHACKQGASPNSLALHQFNKYVSTVQHNDPVTSGKTSVLN